MFEIFANRLMDDDLSWKKVPSRYKDGTLAVLESRVEQGLLTKKDLNKILKS